MPQCVAEFQFRYNNLENSDIFGTAINFFWILAALIYQKQ